MSVYQDESIIPIVKYAGGSIILIWDCFAASGPLQFAITKGKMNTYIYKDAQHLEEEFLLLLHMWLCTLFQFKKLNMWKYETLTD